MMDTVHVQELFNVTTPIVDNETCDSEFIDGKRYKISQDQIKP